MLIRTAKIALLLLLLLLTVANAGAQDTLVISPPVTNRNQEIGRAHV